MAVEIQVRSDVFLAAQLRRLQAVQICPPPPFDLPGGLRLQLQRIEPLPSSLRRDVEYDLTVFQLDTHEPDGLRPFGISGRRPQIVQPVQVDVCDYDDLLRRAEQGEPPLVASFVANLVVGLSYYSDVATSCFLKLHLDDIELPGLPTGLPIDLVSIEAELRRIVTDAIGPLPAVDFDFASLLWPNVVIANAAVSVAGDGSLLAFRAEPALGVTPDVAWTNFTQGAMVDHLAGADWAFHVDGAQLAQRIATEIENALAAVAIPPEVRIHNVWGEYSVHNGVARVRVAIGIFVDAEITEEYLEFGVPLDFTADAATGELIVDADLGEIQELIDRIRSTIEIGLALFAPPLYLVLELAFGEELDKLSNLLGSLPAPPAGTGIERISPTHYRYRQALPALDPSIATRVLSCVGTEDGVAIVGALPVAPVTPSTLVVSDARFAWAPEQVTCSQLSEDFLRTVREHPERHGSLYAEITLDLDGTRPARICDVQVLDDAAGVYPTGPPGLVRLAEQLPTKIEIRPALPDFSGSEPQPMRVLIRTTAGVRMVVIPAPAAMTGRDRNFIRETLAVRLEGCPLAPLDLVEQLQELIRNRGRIPDPRPDWAVIDTVTIGVGGIEVRIGAGDLRVHRRNPT